MISFFHLLLRPQCHRGGCSKDKRQSCALWVSSHFTTKVHYNGYTDVLPCLVNLGTPITMGGGDWLVKKAAGKVLKGVKALFVMKKH